MPRLAPRLAVFLQAAAQFGKIHPSQPHENGPPLPPQPRESLGGGSRDAQRRMGLLPGPRRYRGPLKAVKLPIVGKRLPLPSLQDDVQRFPETLAAFAVGNAVQIIRPRETAAPHPELEPPLADLIQGRHLLGNPQRIIQGQHMNRHPDAQPPRPGRDGAGDHERRRQHRPRRIEVQFRQPHPVQPPILRRIHQPEPLPERLPLRHPRPAAELHKDAKVHIPSKNPAPPSAAPPKV